MKSILFCFSLAFWVNAWSAELSRKDFAYGAQLQTPASAAAYEFTLPMAVLQQTAFSDLRDVRVFNADDQLVPYSLLRSASKADMAHRTVALPLFPLRGNAEKILQSLRVNIAAAGGDISVRVPKSTQSSMESSVTAYLLDARSEKQAVSALELHLKNLAKSFSTTVTLEGSDDLTGWQVIRSGAPFVNIEYNNQRLREQRIEFPPIQKKFWRLSAADRDALGEIESVIADVITGTIEPERQRLTVTGTLFTDETKQNVPEYRFDVGMHAPIDRVNLLLPETNSVLAAQIFSRSIPTSDSMATPWRWVGQHTFYRLQRDAQELLNRPLNIAVNSDRHWAVRLETKAGAIGSAVPQLQIEWLPQRVIFLARGKSPYWLAFGNASAAAADSSLPNVVTDVAVAETATDSIRPSSANVSDVIEVGGASRLRVERQIDWKTIALWISLVAGVGLLAWMALRLLRDLNASK